MNGLYDHYLLEIVIAEPKSYLGLRLEDENLPDFPTRLPDEFYPDRVLRDYNGHHLPAREVAKMIQIGRFYVYYTQTDGSFPRLELSQEEKPGLSQFSPENLKVLLDALKNTIDFLEIINVKTEGRKALVFTEAMHPKDKEKPIDLGVICQDGKYTLPLPSPSRRTRQPAAV